MKNTFLFLLGFILCSINLNAQKWALPSSTWITSYAWFSFPTYTTVEIEKDTVVQDILCKKLNSNPPILTYEENDTVYFFHDGLFRATYYFNVEVGDTISLYDHNYCLNGGVNFNVTDSILYATIDSIDSIDVGNKFLKKYNCTIFVNDSIPYMQGDTFSYTELIGSNYIYPNFECVADQEQLGICNYGDSTIQNFYVFNKECIGVSINDLENPSTSFSLYPSPAKDIINVVRNDVHAENLNLIIRNLNGQKVYESSLSNEKSQIKISHLSSGVYLVTFNGQENYKTLKFIKE